METVGAATWSPLDQVAAARRHGGDLRRDIGPEPGTPSSTRIFFLQLRIQGSTMGTRRSSGSS